MPSLSPNEHAAFAQVAAILAPLVTTANISKIANQLGVVPEGSNKANKVRDMLMYLWCDRRRPAAAETAVISLLMEAHARSAQGLVKLFAEDVDDIVRSAKELGFSFSDIARAPWRRALKRRTPAESPAPAPTQSSPPRPSPAPRRHEDSLAQIQDLIASHVVPQYRGRRFEEILLLVLVAEQLQPQKGIVSAGEEIDLACVIDSQHYLIECKWEKDPIGLPAVRNFAGKIDTKASGTFGVLLSMSGFVDDINDKAHRGRQLACVGLGPQHLMDVLEGRTRWAAAVRAARTHASRTSRFYVP